MINEYMELAFDTNSNAFTEMVAIIGPAMFRKKFEGSELHHIVPVTYFAQNDEERPSWASISDWGKLIRNSDSHPANQEWNLVYLTKDEHNKVHELISKMSGEDWKAPSKGNSTGETGKIYTPKFPKWNGRMFIRKEENGYTLLKGITAGNPSEFHLNTGFDFCKECWGKELDHDVFSTALWKLEVLVRGSAFADSFSKCYEEAIDFN